ncbi:MAG: thioesterase family protein [Desertimonas sp.]
MTWNGHAALTSRNATRFTAEVDDHWSALSGLHGGVVAGLMAEAVEAVLGDDGGASAATLRAATFGFVRTNRPGALDIDVDVVRRGRSMVTSHVTTSRAATVTTVGRTHHSAARDGHEFSDAAPAAPRPPDTVAFDPPAPNHFANVDLHLHPDTQPFCGADRAEWIGWGRPRHGDVVTSAWLVMFGDLLPPAVFARVEQPSPAVSVEYSIQIHDDAGSWSLAPGEYLATRAHAFHSHRGFAIEDGSIHLPDGALLATVRQTRLAG